VGGDSDHRARDKAGRHRRAERSGAVRRSRTCRAAERTQEGAPTTPA